MSFINPTIFDTVNYHCNDNESRSCEADNGVEDERRGELCIRFVINSGTYNTLGLRTASGNLFVRAISAPKSPLQHRPTSFRRGK